MKSIASVGLGLVVLLFRFAGLAYGEVSNIEIISSSNTVNVRIKDGATFTGSLVGPGITRLQGVNAAMVSRVFLDPKTVEILSTATPTTGHIILLIGLNTQTPEVVVDISHSGEGSVKVSSMRIGIQTRETIDFIEVPQTEKKANDRKLKLQ